MMPVNNVAREREWLHNRVRKELPIEMEDLYPVNTFARMETMKEATRRLMSFISKHASKSLEEVVLKELDIYDSLAIDWVYGAELEWQHSMAERQAEKIENIVVDSLIERPG